MIISYTAAEQEKVARVLTELNAAETRSIVLIDARTTTSRPGSKA